jgi:hypothetical protein
MSQTSNVETFFLLPLLNQSIQVLKMKIDESVLALQGKQAHGLHGSFSGQ